MNQRRAAIVGGNRAEEDGINRKIKEKQTFSCSKLLVEYHKSGIFAEEFVSI
jgi:hypothetical protein